MRVCVLTTSFLLYKGIAAGIHVIEKARHLVKLGAAYVGGRAADRHGPRSVLLTGWWLYGALYLGLALTDPRRPGMAAS